MNNEEQKWKAYVVTLHTAVVLLLFSAHTNTSLTKLINCTGIETHRAISSTADKGSEQQRNYIA
jgi:hypothetical protein